MGETNGKTPKRLVVANTKGGVGKSTTARNLATIAAADGFRVATVDLDTQRTLSQWSDRRPQEAGHIPNFTGYMSDVQELDTITGFDVVIIDTPPLVTTTESDHKDQRSERMNGLAAIVRLADFILVPTGQQIEDISATTAFMKVLTSRGVRARSFLNGTSRRANSFNEARRKLTIAGQLCPVDIPRLEDIPVSSGLGIGINELRRAKGADDFIAAWAFCKAQLGLQAE